MCEDFARRGCLEGTQEVRTHANGTISTCCRISRYPWGLNEPFCEKKLKNKGRTGVLYFYRGGRDSDRRTADGAPTPPPIPPPPLPLTSPLNTVDRPAPSSQISNAHIWNQINHFKHSLFSNLFLRELSPYFFLSALEEDLWHEWGGSEKHTHSLSQKLEWAHTHTAHTVRRVRK